jgi:hypothetical protein
VNFSKYFIGFFFLFLPMLGESQLAGRGDCFHLLRGAIIPESVFLKKRPRNWKAPLRYESPDLYFSQAPRSKWKTIEEARQSFIERTKRKFESVPDLTTVLSGSEASSLMAGFCVTKPLRSLANIVWGCNSRAEEISIFSSDRDIYLGRLIAAGNLAGTSWVDQHEHQWGWHIVPYARRFDGNGNGIWIFDVAISPKPLTLAEWMRAITDPAAPVEIDLELEPVREIRPIDAIQLYQDWTGNL